MTGHLPNLPDGCTDADIDRAMGGDGPFPDGCPECGGVVSDDEYPWCLGYPDDGEAGCGWHVEEPDWERIAKDRAWDQSTKWEGWEP